MTLTLSKFKLALVVFSAVSVTIATAGTAKAVGFTEGFDDVRTLAGKGWVEQNNSQPVGIRGWEQGNPFVFIAHSGADNSYLAVNFQSAGETQNPGEMATISNWLLTPVFNLQNGDTFSFFTRAPKEEFSDRLQVLLSTNGSSTNVGSTATSVGDFTTTLLDINPNLTTTDYPRIWTEYNLTLSGLSAPTSGRLAFRYFATDGGPSGKNGNYIGIDTFSTTATATPIPEPATVIGSIATLGWGILRLGRKQKVEANRHC